MTHPADRLVPQPLRDKLIALRHDLHRQPELSGSETGTADRLARELEQVVPGAVRRIVETGVVVRIPGRDRAAPVVAIRGDIDALPVQEETGCAFESEHAGVMHACGHDVHAAWTVGAAHLLKAHPAAGDVLILLQPAEETGRGALAVLASGALNGVRMIFGGHVDMRFALGEIVADEGPVAASTDDFRIEIVGRGAHAARPHEAADPIVAAAAVVDALQRIVSRRLAPGEPGVVTVGTFKAGTAANVIPDRATLTGTFRAVRPETRAFLERELRAVVARTAEAHGTRATITVNRGTPPIVNPPGPVATARAAAAHVLGPDALRSLMTPNLGGEDFSFYLERIPGCFVRVGARGPDQHPVPAHSSKFLPDDRTVLVGAAVLAEMARRA